MNGCVTAISIDFQLKAMDSKLITILNQRTGSYCYCCTVSSAEAHNIETVSKGFYMEFGMDRLWETVEKLMADHNVPREEWDTFELPSVTGDYEVRLVLKRTMGSREDPSQHKERLERARDEWKGEYLGNLIGYRQKKATNQITGH